MNQSPLLDVLFFGGKGVTDDQQQVADLLRKVEDVSLANGKVLCPLLLNDKGRTGVSISVVGAGGRVERTDVYVTHTSGQTPEEVERLLTEGLVVSLEAVLMGENGVQ